MVSATETVEAEGRDSARLLVRENVTSLFSLVINIGGIAAVENICSQQEYGGPRVTAGSGICSSSLYTGGLVMGTGSAVQDARVSPS